MKTNNMKTVIKFDSEKIRYDLIPVLPLEFVMRKHDIDDRVIK